MQTDSVSFKKSPSLQTCCALRRNMDSFVFSLQKCSAIISNHKRYLVKTTKICRSCAMCCSTCDAPFLVISISQMLGYYRLKRLYYLARARTCCSKLTKVEWAVCGVTLDHTNKCYNDITRYLLKRLKSV
jgi:hypothetical protein